MTKDLKPDNPLDIFWRSWLAGWTRTVFAIEPPKEVVRPVGVEPTTDGVEARCSIR